MMLSRPLGWLKKTKRDQWMSQVLCCRDWRGELTDWRQRTQPLTLNTGQPHTHPGISWWEIKHPGLVQGWQLHLINKLVMSREETMGATSGAVWRLLLSIKTSLIINVVHVLLQNSPNGQTAVFTYSILLEHRHYSRWSELVFQVIFAYIIINGFPQPREILHGCFPVLHEDLRGQFPPQGTQGISVCGGNLNKGGEETLLTGVWK